jgi:hypothetical protein
MTLTYDQARELVRRSRYGTPRLGNNTHLHAVGADDYAVQYHSTYVVTIHRDGTYTLNTGGWDTVTTKDRIRGYSPARVSSEGGELHVWHASDPKTEPKIRPCRKCRGVGRVREPGRREYYEYAGWEYKRIFPPRIVLPRWAVCWNCGGTGQRDYGSKPMPVVFFDGIRVDSTGRVVDADQQARLREPIEVTLARNAVRMKAERAAWFKAHKLTPRNGEVRLFKAVRDDLRSANGGYYPIGGVTVAEDYSPDPHCGNGLHFSPTVAITRRYDQSATRFLACAVDVATLTAITDGYDAKAKARSCRVMYEVDEDGRRLPRRTS